MLRPFGPGIACEAFATLCETTPGRTRDRTPSEGKHMHRHTKWFAILIALTLFASACSASTADPTTTTPVATTAAATTTQAPSTTTASESTTTAVEEQLEDISFAIEEGTTTLLRLVGDARASRDDGETWFYAESGLWLETGDRIQVPEGGISLILLQDGSIIRLEGFADFKLVRAEFDLDTGARRIIGYLLDGAAMVSTTPLPTADSLFQLWSLTTFIDLPFDPDTAVPLNRAATVPEEERLTFGAAVREDLDGEALFTYDATPADLYALEIIEGDVVVFRIEGTSGQFTELRIPYRDEIQDEFTLEGLVDIAAALVEASRTTGPLELDVLGNSLVEEGELADGETLFSLVETTEVAELLAEGSDERQAYLDEVRQHPRYLRWAGFSRVDYLEIPDIFAPEILMGISAFNLGCDIRSGLGCSIPAGCNTETGDGCTFVSGCNIVTRDGCATARLRCATWTQCDPSYRYSCVIQLRRTVCRPDVKTFCDPEKPGDCDRYIIETAATDEAADGTSTTTISAATNEQSSITTELATDAARAGQPLMNPNDVTGCLIFMNADWWLGQAAAAGVQDDFDDEDIEWCRCRASVPPGYPAPPPWMDMTYRCFCDESLRFDD